MLIHKAKHEFKAAKHMQNIKIDSFYNTLSQDRGERKKKLNPTFPYNTYLFMQRRNTKSRNSANAMVCAVKIAARL
jgi:hypothetical protein